MVTMPSFLDVCMTVGIWKVLPSRMRFETAVLARSTSRAAARPPPFFFTSVCEITPFSDSLSIVRICACRSAGN